MAEHPIGRRDWSLGPALPPAGPQALPETSRIAVTCSAASSVITGSWPRAMIVTLVVTRPPMIMRGSVRAGSSLQARRGQRCPKPAFWARYLLVRAGCVVFVELSSACYPHRFRCRKRDTARRIVAEEAARVVRSVLSGGFRRHIARCRAHLNKTSPFSFEFRRRRGRSGRTSGRWVGGGARRLIDGMALDSRG